MEMKITDENITILCDCKVAIESTTHSEPPTSYHDITIKTKKVLVELTKGGNSVQVIWTPGHMGVVGNELADGLAKEGARESAGKEHMLTPHMTKQDIKREINTNTHERWQRRYSMSTTSGITHEAVKKVGERKMGNSTYRTRNILLNQILSGHTRLNEMNYRVNPECTSNTCEHCKKVETIDHYLWECEKYKEQRNVMERDTYLCLEQEGIQHVTAAGRLELHTGRGIFNYWSNIPTIHCDKKKKTSTAVTEGEECHRDYGRKTSTAITEGEECHRDCVEKMSTAATEGEHRDYGRKTSTAVTEGEECHRYCVEKKSAAVTEGEHRDCCRKTSTAITEGEECHRDCVEKMSTAATEGEHRDYGRKTSTAVTEGEECHRDCVEKMSTAATEGEHRDYGRKTSTAVTEGEECHRDCVEKMSTGVTEGEHRDCVRKTSTAGTEGEESHRDCVEKTSTAVTEGEECQRDCVEKKSAAVTEGEHRDCCRKTSTAVTEGKECHIDCVKKTSAAVTEGEHRECGRKTSTAVTEGEECHRDCVEMTSGFHAGSPPSDGSGRRRGEDLPVRQNPQQVAESWAGAWPQDHSPCQPPSTTEGPSHIQGGGALLKEKNDKGPPGACTLVGGPMGLSYRGVGALLNQRLATIHPNPGPVSKRGMR
ncbi:hypothetical protein Bbelb_025400 [Branchiostoma belcheri]|nr:hypothetical protein Bbelb_025400 [Branchiostoma belcheri]